MNWQKYLKSMLILIRSHSYNINFGQKRLTKLVKNMSMVGYLNLDLKLYWKCIYLPHFLNGENLSDSSPPSSADAEIRSNFMSVAGQYFLYLPGLNWFDWSNIFRIEFFNFFNILYSDWCLLNILDILSIMTILS